jgi:uncharacterized protein YndB with AHSA1/START domain
MNATHHTVYIEAPPSRVYAALLDPQLIPRWRVPTGMRCRVHEFDAREGGAFRVSLTYEAPDAVGKSSDRTDTYRGRFERLVPDACVVERLELRRWTRGCRVPCGSRRASRPRARARA